MHRNKYYIFSKIDCISDILMRPMGQKIVGPSATPDLQRRGHCQHSQICPECPRR
ncbi:hypothetical protein DSUL_20061 [Desulfovibrionales bacterium]